MCGKELCLGEGESNTLERDSDDVMRETEICSKRSQFENVGPMRLRQRGVFQATCNKNYRKVKKRVYRKANRDKENIQEKKKKKMKLLYR
jgi:hypothetical protein